jgi:hypothetical protein
VSCERRVQTHSGYGFTVDYEIERKFRETRLYQVAPISTNLILCYVTRPKVAEVVLGGSHTTSIDGTPRRRDGQALEGTSQRRLAED